MRDLRVWVSLCLSLSEPPTRDLPVVPAGCKKRRATPEAPLSLAEGDSTIKSACNGSLQEGFKPALCPDPAGATAAGVALRRGGHQRPRQSRPGGRAGRPSEADHHQGSQRPPAQLHSERGSDLRAGWRANHPEQQLRRTHAPRRSVRRAVTPPARARVAERSPQGRASLALALVAGDSGSSYFPLLSRRRACHRLLAIPRWSTSVGRSSFRALVENSSDLIRPPTRIAATAGAPATNRSAIRKWYAVSACVAVATIIHSLVGCGDGGGAAIPCRPVCQRLTSMSWG